MFSQKIAQISLSWQQIKNRRTTFCSFGHAELMAKNWLDSIEKKGRRSNVSDKQTDGQTDRQTESTTKNNRLLA